MTPVLQGLLAEFDTPEALLAAAKRAYEKGHRRLDAFSPFPIEGLDEAIGFKQTRLPRVVFIGGLAGCLAGYLLQYYISVVDYPLNIGNRPLHSWPAFIPVTFECAILAAGLTAVFGMFAMNGLPQPHHPVFNAPRFQFASRDRFFLYIESSDPLFEKHKTREFLQSLKPQDIAEVEDG